MLRWQRRVRTYRSYRSNTTLTMLPICPQNHYCTFFSTTTILSVHYRPLWYLPKYIFFTFFPPMLVFCLFPHRKLVEEGSNLRSYRSSTTLTVLPICPHQDCSCCIRLYPYLWYPPCYISFARSLLPCPFFNVG